MPENGGHTKKNRPFASGSLSISKMSEDINPEEMNDDELEDRISAISRASPRNSAADGSVSTVGNLTVYVQQAQNLPGMDKNGKSDPYVKLKICDQNGNKLSAKTSTIFSSVSPKWYGHHVTYLLTFSHSVVFGNVQNPLFSGKSTTH